jgi:hypothetical protein
VSLFVVSPEIEDRGEVEVANWGNTKLALKTKNKHLHGKSRDYFTLMIDYKTI